MTTAYNDHFNDLWGSFVKTADRMFDRPAVTTTDGTMTFGQVRQHAETLAGLLTANGVGAHDVVHLALPNSLAFLPALLALRHLNVTVGLVSSRYRDAEFGAVTKRMPPAAYLTTAKLAGILSRAIDVKHVRSVPFASDQGALSLVFPAQDMSSRRRLDGRLALLKFTSGSTGAPKGVGLTEANLMAEANNIIATLGITEGDRIVVPVPVSHSYGFDLGLLPLVVAGAQVVLRHSFIPREVLHDLSDPTTAIFLGVPSMYRILVESNSAEIPDLSHIRYLLSCTAPLVPSLIEECRERLGVEVCQHYGSSETGAIANHRPPDVARHPGSVGIAMQNVDVRIVGENGKARVAGEEGEIVVRSAAVAAGYITDEQAAATEAFVPAGEGINEYHTGDIGVMNEDGFIFWRGRLDQVINVGGLKVYPSEVVQVLERCPGVSKARVVPARDRTGEEVVHAVVTLSQSMREKDILSYCRQHLADFKIPRRIEIVDAITELEREKISHLEGES